jgi:hypothetical protein
MNKPNTIKQMSRNQNPSGQTKCKDLIEQVQLFHAQIDELNESV